MKQYYRTSKWIGDTENIAYWHGDMEKSDKLIKFGFDFILPLGTRKPRNVSRETIMEF